MKKWLLLSTLFLLVALPAKAETMDLQQLIDATPAGGELQLQDGIYKGSFRINKPIKVIGSKNTILQGTAKETLLQIENSNDVTLENLQLKTAKTGIAVKKVNHLYMSGLKLTSMYSGVQLNYAEDVEIAETIIQGIDGHYSKKGNGVAAFNSKRLQMNGLQINQVQDGLYIENVSQIELQNNVIRNSRYGIHFMYTENAKAIENKFNKNVTGIMLMMTKNTDLQRNEINEQNGLNGFGVVLFDGQNIDVEGNVFQSNRTAISAQKLQRSTMKENRFQMNQSAVELIRSNAENSVIENDFIGNIVNLRSDGSETTIQHNYYDDYDGIDVDDDGIGDCSYVALQSFGQWMVRQPAYQYFVESPSVVLLNEMDKQTNAIETDQLVDEKPRMMSLQSVEQPQKRNIGKIVIGIAIVLSGLWLWRREAAI
ncbi:right-handed parallel beta-helix repeat-containing protein [Viridibacillus soli]|uniref:right-handed parallel beta-helix repeat-containing protein n=1 Tax=Viridibacillus soli TaxID=2798301 RepID=UPI002D7E28F8|nr:NosD domain-containing protein [Viridibacillus soli]